MRVRESMCLFSSLHERARRPFASCGSQVLIELRTRRQNGHTPLDRDGEDYTKLHYRAHWQPIWAVIGLTTCTLLMVFSGWAAIFNLCNNASAVSREDAIVDLVAVYLGVINATICEPQWANVRVAMHILCIIPHLQVCQTYGISQSSKYQGVFERPCIGTR